MAVRHDEVGDKGAEGGSSSHACLEHSVARPSALPIDANDTQCYTMSRGGGLYTPRLAEGRLHASVQRAPGGANAPM